MMKKDLSFSGSANSCLPSGHWAAYRGCLCKAWVYSNEETVALETDSPSVEGFRQVGERWLKRGVGYPELDDLFTNQTVCEWNGGLWLLSGVCEGLAFLDFMEGSFPYYLMEKRPGVERSAHYGHLVGAAPLGELANIRTWSYHYDLETREPIDKESMPQLSELVNEFAATHPQSE